MQEKQRRTLLIVPPQATHIRSIRIRMPWIIGAVIVLAVGIAGLCIPASTTQDKESLDNRLTNLSQQNRTLLQKIRIIRLSLNRLQEKVMGLEDQRRTVVNLSRFDSLSVMKRHESTRPVTVDELQGIMPRIDRIITQSVHLVETKPGTLKGIPCVKPLAKNPSVSLGFGRTSDPFTNEAKWHRGVDFIAPSGEKVYATADGRVLLTERNGLWGYRVILAHAQGYQTVYAHLGSIVARQGSVISRGMVVGTVGSSGVSTGPHLHYEIVKNGRTLDPFQLFFPDRES